MPSRTSLVIVCCVLAALFISVAPLKLRSQGIRTTGQLIGRVLAADSSPLIDVVISVEGTAFTARSRRTGLFIVEIPGGEHIVFFKKLGYRTVQRVVTVREAESSSIADTLRIEMSRIANALRTVTVRATGEPTNATVLTTPALREAPPLGEADVFRGLPLLPSVAQPNDVINRIHLAGGASDEHSITLDDHPLQAPLHIGSVLGAFNVAALEKADVRMHRLPVERDGQLSGEIALQTKLPDAHPSREIVASVLSASSTVSQSVLGTDVLLSARTSYVDQVLKQISKNSPGTGDDLLLPGFQDALLRLSREWRTRWYANVTAFATRDRAKIADPDGGETPTEWGESMGGARAGYVAPHWNIRARVSTNLAFSGRTRFASATMDSLDLTLGRIRQRRTEAAVTAEHSFTRWRLSGGASVVTRVHEHRWNGYFVEELLKSAAPLRSNETSRQQRTSAFVELAVFPTSAVTASAGTHVSVVGGQHFASPRILLAQDFSDRLRGELSIERRHQFDAVAGEPLEGSITQPVFLLSSPRIADVLGSSLAFRPNGANGGVSLSASAYARRYRERTLALPTIRYFDQGYDYPFGPPPAPVDSLPTFQRGECSTLGLALRAEYAGSSRVLARASYTLQRAREVYDGTSRPASWDAPHQLSALVSVPLSRRWTLSGVGQLRSGTAVTPVKLRTFVPIGDGWARTRFAYGDPNSARLAGYSRVDVALRRSWVSRGADWTVSIQAINLLRRVNALEYDWTSYFACKNRSTDCDDRGARRRSLPILPSIGMEVKW